MDYFRQRSTILKLLPLASDLTAPAGGDGGWLLAKIAQAGAWLPTEHFGREVRLVHIGSVELSRSIGYGDCVTFSAMTLQADVDSVEVEVTASLDSRREVDIIARAVLKFVPA